MQINKAVQQPPKRYEKSVLNCLVPEFVKKNIGYEGWAWMSWTLHNGYVQDHKHFLSQTADYDVGVPVTVTSLIDKRLNGLKEILEWNYIDLNRLQQLTTIGYLIGTDFMSKLWVRRPNDPDNKWIQTGIISDEHGANQLEGELRRWKNRQSEKPMDNFDLHEKDVELYCQTHKLCLDDFSTATEFKKKIGVLYQT